MTAVGAVDVNVRVPAADGTLLATDVVRPARDGVAPVVVLRTPHGKASHLDEALAWARNGFACVVQDVRGRHDSDGQWLPYRHERADSAALVDWLVEQRWAGRVVAYGGSYAAFTAWCAAVERPHSVWRLISLVPAMGLGRVKFHASGILRLDEHVGWWLSHAETRTSRPGLYEALLDARPDLLRHLPVVDIGRLMWARLPHWTEPILDGPQQRAAWDLDDEELARVTAPTLHVGGWHDLFVDDTLHHWQITGTRAASRPASSLVVGPWTHDLGAGGGTVVGARDHGPGSRRSIGAECLRWLRDETQDEPGTGGRGRVFVMGEKRWLTVSEWPPATSARVAYFAAGGAALARSRPSDAGSDRFRYDPLDPFPSVRLPVDVAATSRRGDVARYTTGPLEGALRLAGGARVELHAASDASVTDWVGRLLEVTEDGRCLPIAWGAVCAPAGSAGPQSFALTSTAIALPRGSRLRMEITSSYFPELARSLNHAGDRYTSGAPRPATQSVHWGPPTPTAVHLPILDERA